jgi:hypothetical protein
MGTTFAKNKLSESGRAEVTLYPTGRECCTLTASNGFILDGPRDSCGPSTMGHRTLKN